jgi:hypothetical protein
MADTPSPRQGGRLRDAQLLTELRDAEACWRDAAEQVKERQATLERYKATTHRRACAEADLADGKGYLERCEGRISRAEAAILDELKRLPPDSVLVHEYSEGIDSARMSAQPDAYVIFTTRPHIAEASTDAAERPTPDA